MRSKQYVFLIIFVSLQLGGKAFCEGLGLQQTNNSFQEQLASIAILSADEEEAVFAKTVSHGDPGQYIRAAYRNLETSMEFKDAVVEEAKASVDYYQARIQTAMALIRRVETDTPFLQINYNRMAKLYEKHAASKQEFENAERAYRQNANYKQLFEANLRKEEADLKAAEARLKQAIAARKLN